MDVVIVGLGAVSVVVLAWLSCWLCRLLLGHVWEERSWWRR